MLSVLPPGVRVTSEVIVVISMEGVLTFDFDVVSVRYSSSLVELRPAVVVIGVMAVVEDVVTSAIGYRFVFIVNGPL